MDELKQAYETLGLPENATREEVENKYFLLLKKARSSKSDTSDINRAYSRIVGHESEKASPAEKQTRAGYFFYYYKFHVIAVIVVLLLATFTIKGFVDRKNEEANKPPLDVSVTVFGNFFSNETRDEQISQNLLALMPDWKRIDVLMTYVPSEMKSQQDMGLQQKAMLTIMTEKMDLMILDERNFDMLAKQRAFVALDSLSIWPELNKNPKRIRSALAENETSAHPYGIDITGHPAFAGTQADIPDERLILAMRADPPNKSKATELMKKLTQSP